MTAKTYEKAENKAEIKHLYQTAFPKEEQMPWWLLRLVTAPKAVALTAYYEDGRFCGFTHTTVAGEILFVMFFAVAEALRGQGCGSAILRYLKEHNPGKTILLNVELLDETAPNYPERVRRMAFYSKNGFQDTGYNIREVGGVFRVLSSTGEMDAKAYQRVFGKMSLGLWRPKITKVQGGAAE